MGGNSSNNNIFNNILKGTGFAFIFTIISLTIFACLLTFTNINENTIQPVVIGITGVSILIGSFIANIKMKKNGALNGILIGILYIGLIYIISSIVSGGNFTLSIGAIIMLTVSMACGAVGGIIGVNISR